MKKKFAKLMFILLTALILLVGCNSNTGVGNQENSNNDSKKETNKSDDTPLKVTIAGGAAGAIWSIIGEGIGGAIEKNNPGTTFTYQPGQDGANVITVTSGQADFGLVSAPSAKWAAEGHPPYKQKDDKVRTVSFLHNLPYHFVVTEESGINSIEQIAKDKMKYVASVNTKDSPFEITSSILFENYGTSYEEIEKNGGKIQFLALNKAYELIKDNKMDGAMSPLPAPTGGLLELNPTKPIKLLPLSDEDIKVLGDRMGAQPYTIKKGLYPFVTEDIPTVTLDTLLITSSDIPEDTVYKVTKAIYENIDYLHTVHKALNDLTPETITNVTGAPLHPGAEKFYKEVGLLK
jgi:TRAP transporter TAXI family solute receptor